jgi:biliverdin reductase
MGRELLNSPVRIGLVGTGYAAKVRAETINAEPRATLVGVVGYQPDKTAAFAATHETVAAPSWQQLVNSDLDLVVIANLNSQHGEIARAALFAGKHVVVEYPLALSVAEGESLVALAHSQQRLLHVEHIELLGGVHQALRQTLPQIGQPFYARYATMTPQHPAPQKWTYHHEQFGFPLVGALSRLSRLIDVFGPVASVHCQANYLNSAQNPAPYYAACLCSAQLRFGSGLVADVLYGKGEAVWSPERKLEVQADRGSIIFTGDEGVLITASGAQPLTLPGRRGLFARDTAAVLDHLLEGQALYVDVADSLYALRVAEAACRSAETGQVVSLASK